MAKRARVGELSSLSGFKVDKILKEDAQARMLALQGRFSGSDDVAVVVLKQKAFDKAKAQDLLDGSSAAQDFNNDIYTTYALTVAPAHCQVTCDVIYPATAKHIQKYSMQQYHVVSWSGCTLCGALCSIIAGCSEMYLVLHQAFRFGRIIPIRWEWVVSLVWLLTQLFPLVRVFLFWPALQRTHRCMRRRSCTSK